MPKNVPTKSRIFLSPDLDWLCSFVLLDRKASLDSRHGAKLNYRLEGVLPPGKEAKKGIPEETAIFVPQHSICPTFCVFSATSSAILFILAEVRFTYAAWEQPWEGQTK